MKNLKSFEGQEVDLKCVITGGEYICTTYADDYGDGDDLYDTVTCRMVEY